MVKLETNKIATASREPPTLTGLLQYRGLPNHRAASIQVLSKNPWEERGSRRLYSTGCIEQFAQLRGESLSQLRVPAPLQQNTASNSGSTGTSEPSEVKYSVDTTSRERETSGQMGYSSFTPGLSSRVH